MEGQGPVPRCPAPLRPPGAGAVRPDRAGRKRDSRPLVLTPAPPPNPPSPPEAPLSHPRLPSQCRAGLGKSLLHPVRPHLWGYIQSSESIRNTPPLLLSVPSDQACHIPLEQHLAGHPTSVPSAHHTVGVQEIFVNEEVNHLPGRWRQPPSYSPCFSSLLTNHLTTF